MATDALVRGARARLWAGRTGLYVVLVAGSIVAILPFLYMIAASLKTTSETITRVNPIPLSPDFWPRVPQWQNYLTAWQEASFSLYLRNSVVISVTTVAGVLVVSSLAAYAFAKIRFPGKNAIFGALLATLMIPETVLLIPNFILVSRLGWVDRLPALTVPFMGSVFYIFLLRQFFTQVPNELIESARIDACSHPRILASIVLPLAKAPLFTAAFLSFIAAWNALQWPMVVTQTATWRPISVGLMALIDEAGPQTELRMAGAAIAMAPILLFYFVAQKQFTEAIARSGLKG